MKNNKRFAAFLSAVATKTFNELSESNIHLLALKFGTNPEIVALIVNWILTKHDN